MMKFKEVPPAVANGGTAILFRHHSADWCSVMLQRVARLDGEQRNPGICIHCHSLPPHCALAPYGLLVAPDIACGCILDGKRLR
jgi:hypothetical protein